MHTVILEIEARMRISKATSTRIEIARLHTLLKKCYCLKKVTKFLSKPPLIPDWGTMSELRVLMGNYSEGQKLVEIRSRYRSSEKKCLPEGRPCTHTKHCSKRCRRQYPDAEKLWSAKSPFAIRTITTSCNAYSRTAIARTTKTYNYDQLPVQIGINLMIFIKMSLWVFTYEIYRVVQIRQCLRGDNRLSQLHRLDETTGSLRVLNLKFQNAIVSQFGIRNCEPKDWISASKECARSGMFGQSWKQCAE